MDLSGVGWYAITLRLSTNGIGARPFYLNQRQFRVSLVVSSGTSIWILMSPIRSQFCVIKNSRCDTISEVIGPPPYQRPVQLARSLVCLKQTIFLYSAFDTYCQYPGQSSNIGFPQVKWSSRGYSRYIIQVTLSQTIGACIGLSLLDSRRRLFLCVIVD